MAGRSTSHDDYEDLPFPVRDSITGKIIEENVAKNAKVIFERLQAREALGESQSFVTKADEESRDKDVGRGSMKTRITTVADKKILWGFVAIVTAAFLLTHGDDFERWFNLTGKLLIGAILWVAAAFLCVTILAVIVGLIYCGFRKIFPKKSLSPRSK